MQHGGRGLNIHPAHPLARALPLFLLAGLFLTALDTTAKYLVRDHSLFLVVWARYAGQMLVVTPFVRHRAGPGFWRTSNLKMQLVRSGFLLAATGCFFFGLRFLPLAEATAIMHIGPILIVLLSMPVLGERPTRARWAAALVGFSGVLVLLRPGSSVLHPAVVLILGAAACNALYQLLTRKLPGDSAYTTLFYSALAGAVGLTVALPWAFDGAGLSWSDAGLLLAMGLFAGLAHFLLITSFMMVPASLLTPFTYANLLWATLFGYVVFGQLPDRWSALGMAIIVGSGVMLALLERRRARLNRNFP
ncbi:MAG: DMT family transporter [Burkholderiales bacterium]